MIGASAGGVKAMQKLVRDLPAGLPASVFVAVHLAPQGRSLLPAILQGAGALHASHPKGGHIMELGQIYMAPPNYHMMLERDVIRVVVHRPSSIVHRPSSIVHRPLAPINYQPSTVKRRGGCYVCTSSWP